MKRVQGFDLNRVFQVRDRLANQAFAGLVGSTADRSILELIALRAADILPGKHYPSIVYKSLEHLAGTMLSRELIYTTSWRLAGNWQRVQAGEIVRPWKRQATEEWIPLQIMEYEYTLSGLRKLKDNSRVFYHMFQLQVVAGTSCPLRLLKGWSKTAMPMVARSLGFTKSWGKHPYKSPWQLVGMRLMGLAIPDLSKEDVPGFREVKVPSSMTSWNRSLLVMRERRPLQLNNTDEAFDCMEGFDRVSVPCHKCFRGYTSCPAATHPYDFEEKKCSKCDEVNWIDTQREDDVCINCSISRKR